MFFNSLDFAVFLPLVFLIYWLLIPGTVRAQNILLAIASFVFYGWWDYRFLALILISILVDFSIGLKLADENRPFHRKLLLYTSIVVNIGLLGFFKYYNFFAQSLTEAFTMLGAPISISSLQVILPVGISFYTFQTLSYTIDVYHKKLQPSADLIVFATYVSFFPQLVAGPIERATNLLPQFVRFRKFDYGNAINGLRQILWGLFKKVVIADTCAGFANEIFNNSADYSGSTLALGALFFTFQIYGDFSGYSDIAIGVARLFGFQLMQNFAYPYFSRDVAEFWRRWHISLSTWFRDYVYIPLGGSRKGKLSKISNTFIIFLVSGFWHGANWTFLAWGFLNALYFLPLLLAKKNRTHLDVTAQGRTWPSGREFLAMLLTFALTVFAWIFFRAESMTHAFQIIGEIASPTLFDRPVFPFQRKALLLLVYLAIFLLIEWKGREEQYAIEKTGLNWPKPLRLGFYYVLVFFILAYSGGEQAPFIYFQF